MYIAVTQRQKKNKYGDLVDILESNYVRYFEKFGIKLVLIPNSTQNPDAYLDELPIGAVILTGGNDIMPELYGGKKSDELSFSAERDMTEKRLIEIAIEKKLPVFGICRGMQFLNIFFGGGLIKDIKNIVGNSVKHVAANHSVKISGEKAVGFLGEKAEVNSYHNSGITKEQLPKELRAFAEASDGVIEGIYHPSLPIAGMEWHPERKSPDDDINTKIMKAFLNKELFWGIEK